MKPPAFKISTRPEGTWAVDVPDPEPATSLEDSTPDADVSRWYGTVRSALEPHIKNPSALAVVEKLLDDELKDLEDPKRPARMAQIATVRTELYRFVDALRENPSAFDWKGSSTGGIDIDPRNGKTLYVGGQAGGFSFFPDGE